MRAFHAAAWTLAFVCTSTVASSAALDGYPWKIRQSGVELTRVYSDWRSNYDTVHHRMGPLYFIDCAEFKNEGSRDATDVQLMFALASPGDEQKAPALAYDTDATLAAGSSSRACRAHTYENGYKGQLLIGWVNAVTYADGSRWHAAPVVKGSARNAPSAAVVLDDPVTYLPLEECDNLTNASDKTISHVQIVFHHVGMDGADLGDDALDIRATITPGNVLKNSCRGFNGYSDPDVFYYARALSHGEATVLPRIFFDGKESKLSATVAVVDFADGTSRQGF
jgi:hypothetical protein